MKKDKNLYLIVKFEEEWKVIRNYSDYAISNFGRIKRLTHGRCTFIGRILKPQIDTNGYLIISLCKNGKAKTITIHKLVTEAFLGPCPDGKEVNHIDGNKKNPYVSNLEYVTPKENMKHAYENSLVPILKGTKHGMAKLDDGRVLKIKKLYKTGKYSQGKLAKRFNCRQATISRIINNKLWKHVG